MQDKICRAGNLVQENRLYEVLHGIPIQWLFIV
jgi:hypothetical protein